jgi:hypothetical protein
MKLLKRTEVTDESSYWDLTIPETHNFILANGMVVHNCGTGVGFSCERQYVNKLPEVPEHFAQSDTVIRVHDSKIGWSRALNELLSLLYAGHVPKWDMSKVRPAGARLKTFGGRASGPAPLIELFEFVVNLLTQAGGRKLTSIEVHDLVCKIAAIVVVGGVRRSALISLSNLSDDRMRSAKVGEWWVKDKHRALANNSAVYTDTPDPGVFMQEWKSLYDSKSGERGIFNREAAQLRVQLMNERRAKEGWTDAKYVREFRAEFGCNPCCLPGDTLVETELGQVEISEIVKDPSAHRVLTMNVETGSIESETPSAGALTRPDAELIELEFDDGTKLRLTPDHQVWTENRGYVQACNLTEDDVIVKVV